MLMERQNMYKTNFNFGLNTWFLEGLPKSLHHTLQNVVYNRLTRTKLGIKFPLSWQKHEV